MFRRISIFVNKDRELVETGSRCLETSQNNFPGARYWIKLKLFKRGISINLGREALLEDELIYSNKMDKDDLFRSIDIIILCNQFD